MITHLTGISAPVHTRDTVEMGMVLPGFGKLKPIPAPMHTCDTLSQVYPYPCHALTTVASQPAAARASVVFNVRHLVYDSLLENRKRTSSANY